MNIPEPNRPTSPAPSHLRASDKEREAVIAELRRHAGAGRLSLEELDQRVGAALAARERGQLDPLLCDLPGSPRRSRRARRAAHARRAHLRVFVLVNLMLIAVWAASGAGPFWPAWPLLGWGLWLAAHSTGWLGGGHRRRIHARERYRPPPIGDAPPNELATSAGLGRGG